MSNFYEWADELFNTSLKFGMGFDELLATGPYWVSPETLSCYEERLRIIRDFQERTVRLFRNVLLTTPEGEVLSWLLNETPESLGISYHKALKDHHYSLPVFFRTDEVSPGRINEIQCPGSLWGELHLMFNYTRALGYTADQLPPAALFSRELHDYLGKPPVVQHLLDNSSAPAGMRYFIENTRPDIKYWSLDKGIKPSDCNFIRSHSFFGLCAENDFKHRLTSGKATFDLPPHVIFDQKAPLVLPFWSATRDFFTDEIRSIFLYSTPLLPSGIEMPGNTLISIADFAKLPQSQRKFYLKYAGSDVSINWGSKAVFRLKKMSSAACLDLLNHCISEFKVGRIWLLQQEEAQDDEIEFSDRHGGVRKQKLRAKFSAFYGPASCFGVLAMHRNRNKVHGQEDTVLSYVLARES